MHKNGGYAIFCRSAQGSPFAGTRLLVGIGVAATSSVRPTFSFTSERHHFDGGCGRFVKVHAPSDQSSCSGKTSLDYLLPMSAVLNIRRLYCKIIHLFLTLNLGSSH